jgi:hypothetical protein
MKATQAMNLPAGFSRNLHDGQLDAALDDARADGIAGAAMSLSSVLVIANVLRLRNAKL